MANAEDDVLRMNGSSVQALPSDHLAVKSPEKAVRCRGEVHDSIHRHRIGGIESYLCTVEDASAKTKLITAVRRTIVMLYQLDLYGRIGIRTSSTVLTRPLVC